MKKKELKDKTFNQVLLEIKQMQPCPFCGCGMGVYISSKWGFQWQGEHKGMCPLEGNPSASYGKLDSLLKEWNTRTKEPPDVK
jgi:hypothetical protein